MKMLMMMMTMMTMTMKMSSLMIFHTHSLEQLALNSTAGEFD